MATWLADHRLATEPEVICHGDMHPFNVLVDDEGRPTVLDWSAAVFAAPSYDLGFTSLMLAEPPLVVPWMLKPLIRSAGSLAGTPIPPPVRGEGRCPLGCGNPALVPGLICLRALTEVAGWAAAGTLSGRDGHPWVINQSALIGRLRSLTGINVPAETAVP